ncbi:hypothetical protein B0H14DRAFT_2574482 [Mycena olivaceomarginata]|nr:hypothetical protein B0H14DRAFT_2574482 [Mycena olivaceomarginata]
MCWYEVLTRTYGCGAYTSGSYATAPIHECAAHQRFAADWERWVVTYGNAPYGGTLTGCTATRYNASRLHPSGPQPFSTARGCKTILNEAMNLLNCLKDFFTLGGQRNSHSVSHIPDNLD